MMGGAWANLIGLILKLAAALGLYSKGRSDQRRKDQIKGLEAKITALQEKADVGEMSDDDRAAELSEWVQPPDE